MTTSCMRFQMEDVTLQHFQKKLVIPFLPLATLNILSRRRILNVRQILVIRENRISFTLSDSCQASSISYQGMVASKSMINQPLRYFYAIYLFLTSKVLFVLSQAVKKLSTMSIAKRKSIKVSKNKTNPFNSSENATL